MTVRKVIHKTLRHNEGGINMVGGLDAVISVNGGEPGGETVVRTSSHRRIVQRGGRTVVDESGAPPADPQTGEKEVEP